MHACKQGDRREKVTKLSWEERASERDSESVPFTAADQLIQGKHLP